MPLRAIAASVVLLIVAGLAFAAPPAVRIEKSGQCVEPTATMRRNHMNMLLHQRDRTVHQGIRTTQHSLKNCIDCHASSKTNSVLGKDGFCESCHTYAAVRVDCFECHSPSPRKTAAAKTADARRIEVALEPVRRVEARAP